MENLSTNESFKIIESVMEIRRRKYEQNGIWLLFWGILIAVAGIAQFIMIKMGMGRNSGLVWLFTMVPAFFGAFIISYLKAKKQIKKQKSPDKLGLLWMFAGLLAMLNGFIFQKYLGHSFTLMIWLPFIMVSLAYALIINNKIWLLMGVLSIPIAYTSLFVEGIYIPLINSLISITLMVIVGVDLNLKHRKNV